MATTIDEKSVFSENALKVLKERYLYVYDKGTPEERQETEEEFFDRISIGNPEYRKMLSNLDFLPNSPTLFNVGIEGAGTLSACFKFDVQDTMESEENFDGIMDVGVKAARVLKWGGGVGYALHVRPKGAHISTTHGKAMGPVAVMRYYNEIATMVTQGGKREGAQMGILHCDHPDIREFIHCKDGGDNLDTFNISVALTDSFMDAAITQPESDEAKLLHEMAESAWRTGDPGVFFIDRAERGNPAPWSGKLTGTNPCGEVPLEDNEACNLGSTNYANHIKNGAVDYEKLEYTTRLATRYLDDVLDLNVFPDPRITEIVNKNRKLGLGACGVADAFALMKIPYASDEAVALSGQWAKNASGISLDESINLSREKGHAPAYDDMEGYEEEQRKRYKTFPRNTTRTCIAPTGTIAILMGASSGIEPHYQIEWDRQLGGDDGELLHERIPVWDQLDGFVPQTAMEIPFEWHIKHQAAWGDETDLAVSKTINLPQNAPVEDVYFSYISMWESDCVGGTIYRDGSRDEQVLTSVGESAIVEGDGGGEVLPAVRRKLPDVRHGITRKVRIGGTKVFMNVGLYPDGSPGELFLNVSQRGSTEDSLFDAVAIFTSMWLQTGNKLEDLIDKFGYSRFEPSGITTDEDIPNATSILAYVFRRMGIDYLDKDITLMNTGMRCPQCGGGVKFEEGCESCVNMCGWSRC